MLYKGAIVGYPTVRIVLFQSPLCIQLANFFCLQIIHWFVAPPINPKTAQFGPETKACSQKNHNIFVVVLLLLLKYVSLRVRTNISGTGKAGNPVGLHALH